MNDRRYPLQQTRTTAACTIAWSLLAPHERQAQANHRQSLECLAERGGLGPVEAWFIVNDRPYQRGVIDDHTALCWLRDHETAVPTDSVVGLLERLTALGQRLLFEEAREGIRNDPTELALIDEAKVAIALLRKS